MPRLLATAFAFAAAIATTLALSCQPADAFFKRHKKVSPPVAATAVGAGVVSTVTYWSLLGWSINKHSSAYNWGTAAAVTGGCMILSPMVAAALKQGELTTREVFVLEGSCIVPIIGGWLVNSWFDANPQWEARPVKAAYRKKRQM